MELDEMYREHAKQVYLYLLSLSHDKALSEDLMQETFAKASLKIRDFRHESTLSSWLCSIARNLYFDFCRKKKRDPEQDRPSFAEVKDPRDPRIFVCLHELPEPYREIIWLRVYGLLSFAQIGEIFSRSESWSRVMYHRGKCRLRESWDKEYEEETHDRSTKTE
ncbi:RNA polymerase sigma factor [Faecalibaculum rodentium]|uniref:RNA polymerase sigma factor n=1 Tax=Faecalibaculum rodentium TaxID=1702221 RepID=UPI0026F3E592|nr:RNA polymerase sigma factor [Faecalibaculum rodentium]